MQHLIGNVVEFKPLIEDHEHYAMGGMRARILHIEPQYIDCPDINDHVYKIMFDFGEFEDFNKPFESYDYYDNNGVANLNAHQAGFYKAQDTVYFSSPELYPFDLYFTVVDEKAQKLHQMFKESGETNYVNWLESKVEV